MTANNRTLEALKQAARDAEQQFFASQREYNSALFNGSEFSPETIEIQLSENLEASIARANAVRNLHLEMLASAYLSMCELSPDQVELVERREKNQTVWFFRPRVAESKPAPTYADNSFPLDGGKERRCNV